ncbi:MAG: hypothetical protein IJY04_01300 [Clostridia bacterium]|nr:hypothetical protein [Clostridia bacterium]
MREINGLSLEQQAAEAREATKRKRKEKLKSVLGNLMFWVLLGTALSALSVFTLWLNTDIASNLVLSLAKVAFGVFLASSLILLISFIVGLNRNAQGVEKAAMVICFVVFIAGFIFFGIFLSKNTGRLWVDAYNVSDDGSGVIYTENSDGDIVVVGASKDITSVVVAPEYDGLKVVTVTESLLKHSQVESLTFMANDDDDTILISDKCFTNGNSLKSVVFNGGRFKLGKVAKKCEHLERLRFEDCVISLASRSDYNSFSGCKRLRNVELDGCTVELDGGKIPFTECSEFDMLIKDSVVSGFSADIHTLTMSGLCVAHFECTSGRNEIDEVVFAEDYDFINSVISNTAPAEPGSDTSVTGYYPIAEAVYIPELPGIIGINWFGDTFEGKVEIYFGGTGDAWQSLSIPSGGNLNYYDGRVVVSYQATHSAWGDSSASE